MAKSKRKSSVVEFVRKHSKKRKKRAVNPTSVVKTALLGQAKELARVVGPAAAAYIVTRIASRMARNVIGSRVPGLARHVSPLTNVGLLVLALYVTGRSKKLQRYQTAVVVGVAVSAVQALLRSYVPGLGRLLDEPTTTPSRNPLAGPNNEGLGGPNNEGLGREPEDGLGDAFGDYSSDTWGKYPGNANAEPGLAAALGPGETDADLYTGSFAR